MAKDKRNDERRQSPEAVQTDEARVDAAASPQDDGELNAALDAGKRDEEFAEDMAVSSPEALREKKDRRAEDGRETADAGRGLGITAIILSVLAFFLWPYILAPAGIIIGVISARRGSSLGWWAVGIGVLALIIMTLIVPFRILF
ncbi:YrzE family protein [Paenactinomyces guangxiensis]|uniref:YrzE family protein n=1 Tax=Paenactinomyces guangxiensis TaxID=1490290 RepID=A0A7W1WNU8_9BACL|nr:YrzE family protein [Paenactinomyces guangxiensis]MBA4493213.1 YrzE family protein [Paenactinomyces guangxiensis]MBH8589937.1 YrzE family protein [Paenactinomyces guangxiensis]